MNAQLRPTTEPPADGSDAVVALMGVGQALASMRQTVSLPALFRHATCALCEQVGFGRAAVFTLRDHALFAENVYARGAPEEGDRLLVRVRRESFPLGPWLHESEVLRRRIALLVSDAPGDAHALATLPGTRSYVAAPVVCHEQAVALFHADHGSRGRAVTDFDRALLWAFAGGFGYALERGVLAERLRRHSERVLALARSTEASVEELTSPAVELPSHVRQISSVGTLAVPDRGLLEGLTRREREVLTMLAEGETNARIAQRLVVTEETVKTHVKHILRKLGARNRSQAVSRYFRTHASAGGPRLAAPASGFG
ncbi:MAG TPA: LuxR C-terminal-related transcriptional regulator [Thermoleophilaceae bacterium]